MDKERELASGLVDFQKEYESRTLDTMPGNEYYAGKLMEFVDMAEQILNAMPEDESIYCPHSQLDCTCNLIHYDTDKIRYDAQIAERVIEGIEKDFKDWIYWEVFGGQDNYLPAKIIKNLKLFIRDSREEE